MCIDIRWENSKRLVYESKTTGYFVNVFTFDCSSGFISFTSDVTGNIERYVYCDGVYYDKPKYVADISDPIELDDGYEVLGQDDGDFVVYVSENHILDMESYMPEIHEVMDRIRLELLLGY